MTTPKFNDKNQLELIDYQGKKIILNKRTWELKIKYPERSWFEYNFDKMEQTLSEPDEVRASTKSRFSKILYRRFDIIRIRPNIEVPFVDNYIAVVVKRDEYTQTFYPCHKIKGGNIIWHKPQK